MPLTLNTTMAQGILMSIVLSIITFYFMYAEIKKIRQRQFDSDYKNSAYLSIGSIFFGLILLIAIQNTLTGGDYLATSLYLVGELFIFGGFAGLLFCLFIIAIGKNMRETAFNMSALVLLLGFGTLIAFDKLNIANPTFYAIPLMLIFIGIPLALLNSSLLSQTRFSA